MKYLSDNDFNDNLLENVPDGANPQSAVNKRQLDEKVTGVNTQTLTVSDTEPLAPQEGDLWVDPDVSDTSLMASIINAIYPVGKLWWSNSATNPGTILGVGTWTRIEGVFIVAASDSDSDFSANATGGVKEVTLTSAQSGLRGHGHELTDPGHNHGVPREIYPGGTGTNRYMSYQGTQSPLPTSVDTTGITIADAQSSDALEPHTNLPPYQAKYCFERIA